MADDLMIRFGGDTSGINKATAEARNTIASFAPGATAMAKSSIEALTDAMEKNQDASKASTASWRENLAALANFTTVARGTIDVLKASGSALYTFEKSMFNLNVELLKAVLAAAEFSAHLPISAVNSAASAFMDYAEAAAHGTGAARSFLHEQDGITGGIGRTVLAIRTYIYTLRLYQTSVPKDVLSGIFEGGGGDAFVRSLQQTDQGLKQAIVGFLAQIQQIPATSDEAAASIQKMLGGVPNYTVQANTALINLIATISATGDAAVANTIRLAAGLKDDSAVGGHNIAEMVAVLVDNLKAGSTNAEAFKKQMGDIDTIAQMLGERMQPAAAAAFYDNILSKLRTQQSTQKAIADANATALAKEGVLGSVVSYTRQHQVELEKDQLAQRQRSIELLTIERKLSAQLLADLEKRGQLQETLDAGKTAQSRSSDLGDQKDHLTAIRRRDPDDVDGYSDKDKQMAIKTAVLEVGNQTDIEIVAMLNTLKNRVAAAYGKYGDSLGEVLQKKRAYTAIDDSKGDFDQSKVDAVPEDARYHRVKRLADKVFGDDPGDDPTGGATHYFNQSLVNPDWAKGMENRRRIGAQSFGNPDGQPVISDDSERSRRQQIAQTNTADRQNDAEGKGGTDEELKSVAAQTAKLALFKEQFDAKQKLLVATKATDDEDEDEDEAKVKVGATQLDQAKQLIVLREKALAAAKGDGNAEDAGTEKEQLSAQKALNEALSQLQVLELGEFKAGNDLKIAQTREGSRERLNLQLAGYDAEIAAAAGNTIKILGLHKQKYEANKAFLEKEKLDQEAAENASFANSMKVLQERQSAIKAQAGTGDISHGSELARTMDVNSQVEAVERAHWTRMAAIAGQYTTEYRTAQTKLLEISEQRHAKDLVAEQTYAKQVEQTFKSSFESVGSSVASSLESIIEKTGTWRQLMQAVAKNVLNQFISAGVRMVADWGAREASKVALSVLAQTQMTAATAAGTAARESLSLAGLATTAAATATSIISSITASAAETFAGIFGFLSPVLGPAAAGPAAAGQATVLGAASLLKYDVGSWSLPSDQLAMVHRGEMIVPASQTPWAQSLMSNAAGGGGQSGGDTHIHMNYSPNVSAIDGRALGKVLLDHSSHVLKAIDYGIAQGQHLAMKNRGRF